ncbi:hypothetical protein ACD578_27590 (plasmid) [Microvirga sp. RSM25]|uniref:hypothetical protein n=1 Tax=Microvirga sp. RSM25 TaxID=3273802 RepID=UPI00384F1A79
MPIDTFATIQNKKVCVTAENSKYIAVETEYFVALLKPILSRIRVDAEWYLSKYEDVRTAIRNGEIASAVDHYCIFGFFEHRMPYEITIDEDWYLDQYPDVREAVGARTFESGQNHFEQRGYREGRFPFAHFGLEYV